MPPGGYGPWSRYKEGCKPLVYRKNFQGLHRLKHQSKNEREHE